jgi:cysteine desulfurase
MALKVYLDNATTTRTDERVVEEMKRFHSENYGAPTTEYGHSWGVASLEALEASKASVAAPLNTPPENVVFTSGGVESNSMAILGVARARGKDKGRIITTKIEHSSVLGALEYLAKEGFRVEYMGVDEKGFVRPDDLEAALSDDTILVTLAHANGEIGTVQPVDEIAKICDAAGVPLHLDARMSFLWEKLDLSRVHADLVSLTAHTIHGPKGVGALVKGKDIKLEPIMFGPGTEFNGRPGTLNLPGAAGMAKAVEIWDDGEVELARKRRDRLWAGIKEAIPDTALNGPKTGRLSNNLSCNFQHIEGESILLYLDMAGVAVSTGSACSSKNLKPSYVLSAIGIPPEASHGSIRFSLSKYNTDDQIDYALEKTIEVVKRLRKMSSMG